MSDTFISERICHRHGVQERQRAGRNSRVYPALPEEERNSGGTGLCTCVHRYQERRTGIFKLEQKRKSTIYTYSAGELLRIEGEFHGSEFVKKQTGVDNVCERAALRACAGKGKLLQEKQAEHGMTLAIAKENGVYRLMENKIYIIGMGPGREDMMTNEAIYALEMADVIIGYTTYVRLLGERFADKEIRSTPMKQEVERCRLCYEEAAKGKKWH